ncbi:MAG: glycoside hydrolase family 43 protein [Rikenellaceae bacterium]|jgi:hypothetical protein|nr:glycoside hydrolase family 43 protein [Rikenellaceae bacterium]
MKKLTAALWLVAALPLASTAQLPLVQTRFTADPAPVVINDTVFLYTTHDEDGARGFEMLDWLLYTSTDMVNWTDHGTVASLKDFTWIDKDNGAWANQVIERNGKYYMYCPIHGNGIGVLVADSPYGPFVDPLGEALVWQKEHWNDIDPTVFIDDDGQAWMYWGNPDLYYVKLNEDMISISGEIVKEPTKPANYQEGPWVYKRGRHYYLAYASTCCPEGIGYAMSDSPTGPWVYKGMIMDATQRTRGNHPGIIDYKGKSYVFGLSYDLNKMKTPEFMEQRSSMASEMTYNLDGTIPTVAYWKEAGVKQIETLDPFRRTQAETIGWGEGVKTLRSDKVGMYVTQIQNNDYIIVRGVDFRQGASSFEIEAASASQGGRIEIRLDDFYGPQIGVCEIGSTGGWDSWKTFIAEINLRGGGVHDLFFIFKGTEGDLFNLDSWQFKQ